MKTYCIHDLSSPTLINLQSWMQKRGWHTSSKPFFSDETLHFPDDIALTLEYKHLLAAHIQNHGFDFMPKSYYIDDICWPDVLSGLPQQASKWILKPSMLNNGQDIHLFHELSDIYTHFMNPKRMGGPQVLQIYIDPPHLIKGPSVGHKYSLRMFVVACLPFGIFLYPQGYYNVSLFPYDVNSRESLRGHLSNEHVLKGRPNVIQIPSFQYQALFEKCYPEVFRVLKTLFSSFRYPQTKTVKLAFFGMDLMLDSNEQVWLLEANHGPCFPVANEHPLQQTLYHGFWEAVLTEILEPIANLNAPALCQFKPLYLLGK